MPEVESTVFIRFPSQTVTRVLHPATVVQAESTNSLTIRPDDDTLSFEVGLEFMIYFEQDRKFVQQPALIEALPGDDPEAGIELKTIGESVPAENRSTYRICIVTSDLTATFGDENDCPLCDVSVSGFAVISSGKYKIGQVIDAELSHNEKMYAGQVSIQSVTELPKDKTRYGANCVKSAQSATSLFKGVQSISMSEQRLRLSRLSRMA